MKRFLRALAASLAAMAATPFAMLWDGVGWVKRMLTAPPPPSVAEEVAEDAAVEIAEAAEDPSSRYLDRVMSAGMHLYRAALYQEAGSTPDLSHVPPRLQDWYRSLDKAGRMRLLVVGSPGIDEHIAGAHVPGLPRVPTPTQYEERVQAAGRARVQAIRDAEEGRDEVSRILLDDLAAAYARDANLETV